MSDGPSPRRARRDRAARGREARRRGRRPAVVLAEEDDRERPDRREVHALVERPAVGGAVAEERDDDLRRAPTLDREPHARREHTARGEHAVGAEVVDRGVGEVHAPALAVADAVRLAVELGHEAAQRAALRDEVAVPAVRRQDVVVGAERRARADRARLLADRRVQEARQTPVREQLPYPLLEQPHAQHARVHLEQKIGTGRHDGADYSTGRSLSRARRHPAASRSRRLSAP